MTDRMQSHQEASTEEAMPFDGKRHFLFDDPNGLEVTGYRRSEVPAELARVITEEYGEEDRQRLADLACRAALGNYDPQYVDPFTRNIVKDAVAMALGLKELPGGEA